MPLTQSREISAASRLENVRYAIRDLACVADEVVKQGHKILPLNIGDPLNFDFQTPAHLIEAVYKAMRDGKNGYAPSSGNQTGARCHPRRGRAQKHHQYSGRLCHLRCQRER